ncbi:protein VASP homolog [Periplaneta americana]|uniref:protein VASP homolog n=1 Tax=Periplaneta americana TaxID=6978 RepID=UPI0037E87AF9
MALPRLMTVLALLASVSLAQQYSGGSNYVDSDYDYEAPAQSAPAPRPSPRSYSRPAPSPIRQSGPPSPRATPVPILKQINRHNEDGSYTYGYEGADGSFKIETKLQTGEVMGKYGYVDDLGKVRVVEYGANKYGFQPAGEGITVAPPTLVDDSKRREGAEAVEYDDGQYYEQLPARASQSASRFSRPVARPAPAPAPAPRPAPRPAPPPPSYDSYESEQSYSAPAPAPAPRPSPPRPSSGGSFGPVPPRAQIPGAIPAGGSSSGIVYSQPRPPIQKPSAFTQATVRQSPPAPVYHAQPIAPSRPQSRQTGGLLDQLAKDYALPPGGQPLHDISFGFY